MHRLTTITVILLAMAGHAAAEPFPSISIERTCRTAVPLDAQDTDPVQSCMSDEAAARSQLEAQWARFAETQRHLCVAETHVSGSPSYVEVLTCLQMYGPGSSAGAARPKRQFRQ